MASFPSVSTSPSAAWVRKARIFREVRAQICVVSKGKGAGERAFCCDGDVFLHCRAYAATASGWRCPSWVKSVYWS